MLIYTVESNPVLSAELGLALEEAGFEARSFSGIAQMQEASIEQAPHAVLASFGGEHVLSYIRAQPIEPEAMVVFALVDTADGSAMLQAVAAIGPLRTAVIPLAPLDLFPKLHAALQTQSLARALAKAEEKLGHKVHSLQASEQRASQANRVLQTATTRLVEAEQLAAVGRVVTGIAHEIGTQLALVGYAEAIKSRVEPNSDLYEFADAIAVAQKRLATMVDQIRCFAVLEPEAVASEPSSLVSVVDEALGILRYDRDFRERKVERKDSSHPLVQLKREQFDQVVINLVSNAVQATRPGDLITIEVAEDLKQGMATLTVADSGQGMSKEVLERLGEPFFTTRGDRGSGLGIGICMSIARAHGGSIMYVSEIGVGTTAKVRVPLLQEGHAP